MLEGKSKYLLGLVILGILGDVASALGLFGWILGQQSQVIQYAGPAFLLVFCLAAVFLFMAVRDDHQRKVSVLADGLHSVTHKLRDYRYEIEKRLNNGNLDLDRLHDLSPSGGQKVVDALEHLLCELTGQKVYTCIRILEPRKGDRPRAPDNPRDAQTVVFCRSAQSPRRRYKSVEQPVVGNSDFTTILIDGHDYFFGLDLDKKAKHEYSNTTSQWEGLYRRAIVVPVRLKTSAEGDTDVHYDLLGFLCADSPHPRAFNPNMEEIYADIMMTAADALYLYLDFVFHLEQNLALSGDDQTVETSKG